MPGKFGWLWSGAAVFAIALFAQDDAPLKARELYYKPLNANPVSHPRATVAKGRKATPKQGESTAPSPGTAPVVRVPQTGGALMNAAYSPQPLGLKYTILKQAGEQYVEVDPEMEFHSGDRIRVKVEANDAAYLYIVMQGSSGTWQLLFPHPAMSGGNNRIERGRSYSIPPVGVPSFYFDEQPGMEKVTLVLTRTPEADLEKLIYATGERNKPIDEVKMMMAQNTAITSEVMGQVKQQMLSRDLVFEKADTNSSDGTMEKAMYIATPDTSAKARVYVDLKLIHK